jgi:hypothetical protein
LSGIKPSPRTKSVLTEFTVTTSEIEFVSINKARNPEIRVQHEIWSEKGFCREIALGTALDRLSRRAANQKIFCREIRLETLKFVFSMKFGVKKVSVGK